MPEGDRGERSAELVVHLPQAFTPSMASALRRLSKRVAPGTSMVFDFSGVSRCQDLALALLARDLAACAGRCSLHGLTHHQEVLLGYLGTDLLPALPLEADRG